MLPNYVACGEFPTLYLQLVLRSTSTVQEQGEWLRGAKKGEGGRLNIRDIFNLEESEGD